MDEHIVRLQDFEGPLDLLVDMIKKKEYDINDLPISTITKDYLLELERMKEHKIEVTSHFVELASILLHIKSKMMLPLNENENDPRDELVKQLVDFQTYKENVEKMKELQDIEHRYFKRLKRMIIKKPKPVSPEDMFNSLKDMLNKKMTEDYHNRLNELTEHLTRTTYTIEDRIDRVLMLLREGPISISYLFSTITDREEAVVTFSALLEIIKSQQASLSLGDEDQVMMVPKSQGGYS